MPGGWQTGLGMGLQNVAETLRFYQQLAEQKRQLALQERQEETQNARERERLDLARQTETRLEHESADRLKTEGLQRSLLDEQLKQIPVQHARTQVNTALQLDPVGAYSQPAFLKALGVLGAAPSRPAPPAYLGGVESVPPASGISEELPPLPPTRSTAPADLLGQGIAPRTGVRLPPAAQQAYQTQAQAVALAPIKTNALSQLSTLPADDPLSKILGFELATGRNYPTELLRDRSLEAQQSLQRQEDLARFTHGLGQAAAAQEKTADDPRLPRVVQAYLLQLRAKHGQNNSAAHQELAKNWPALQRAHPTAAPTTAAAALRDLFAAPIGAGGALSQMLQQASPTAQSNPEFPAVISPTSVGVEALTGLIEVEAPTGERMRLSPADAARAISENARIVVPRK